MLPTQDPSFTSASKIPMTSLPQTGSPQDTNFQIDDNYRPSAMVAAAPQYIDGCSVPSTHTVDPTPSPSSPSLHNSHIHLTESSSPSVSNNPHAYTPSSASNPQAYSPAFTSPTTPASSYIPPPSPTPSQKYVYPVQEDQYYTQGDGTSQHHPYMYQQQQGYPEPTLRSYPEPTFVDINEKPDQAHTNNPAATTLTASRRRKKLIWIGIAITLLLLGIAIGLVFGLKDNSSNSNNNGGSGPRTAPTLVVPTGTWPDIPFPTEFPTGFPTNFPTAFPSNFPTAFPSNFPTAFPSGFPMPSGFPFR